MVLKNYRIAKTEQELALWLKNQRKSRGMTQRDLASELGCAHTFVDKVEDGMRGITVAEYLAYCQCLGVSPYDGIEALRARKN